MNLIAALKRFDLTPIMLGVLAVESLHAPGPWLRSTSAMFLLFYALHLWESRNWWERAYDRMHALAVEAAEETRQ